MGFEESAIKSIKYNRSQLRKKSIFENQKLYQSTRKSENLKPRRLSEEALLRIEKQQSKNTWKSITSLTIIVILTFLVIWYFLL